MHLLRQLAPHRQPRNSQGSNLHHCNPTTRARFNLSKGLEDSLAWCKKLQNQLILSSWKITRNLEEAYA